jgi:Xaa-Pro dipeptidase
MSGKLSERNDKKVQEGGNPVEAPSRSRVVQYTTVGGVDSGEIQEKLKRIRAYLRATDRSALVIGRRDNFAWLTGGGDNSVVRNSELGFSLLVVTDTSVYHLAQVMDGPRILDEELQGIGVEPVFLRWYEQSREERAAQLIKGRNAASDIPIEGAVCVPKDIVRLHYPLTAREIEKYRVIGRKTEEVIGRVAAMISPGMREREIEAVFLGEYARQGMSCDVLLIGSDERIGKYRHPVPSDKPVQRLVLLHPAVRKWGLHANVTRMVYFGDRLPADLTARYAAACRVEAAAISQCVAGKSFSEILEREKRVYAEAGFAEEWRNHYQGGITGYVLADPTLCMDPAASVSANQAFDWFITITGVKVEELTLSGAEAPEVLSACGGWPRADFEHDGVTLRLPQILQR